MSDGLTQLKEQLESTPTGRSLLRGAFVMPVRDAEITETAELESATDGMAYVLRDGSERRFFVVDGDASHEIAGSVEGTEVLSTGASDGQVLTADGAGGAAWETISVPITVSDTEPSTPTIGDLWVDTSTDTHVVLWIARDDGA